MQNVPMQVYRTSSDYALNTGKVQDLREYKHTEAIKGLVWPISPIKAVSKLSEKSFSVLRKRTMMGRKKVSL
jgi:hypothetical protein